jgi:hypothetical protein
MVAAAAVVTAAPTYLAMFDTPEASPTWLAGTAAVAAEDAGPFDSPIPIATAIRGSTNAPYFQDGWSPPMMANPTAVMANPAATTLPATEPHRQPGDERRHGNESYSGRECGQPRLQGREAEGDRVLEVEAQQVHEGVDGAGADEDRHR